MASSGSNVYILIAAWIVTGVVHSFVSLDCDKTSVGQLGLQTMLTCVIKPGPNDGNVKVRVVTWKKMGMKTPLLFIRSGDTGTFQSGYKFADPSWDENNMNVSLLITDTKVADKGDYSCKVITDTGDSDSTTKLRVTARYNKPAISRVHESDTPNAHSTLICTSGGGYPKGELRWYDENNVEWTAGAQLVAEEMDSGLYQLTSKLPLLPASTFSRYTCVVFNSSGTKEDEISFEMPPQHDELGGQKNSITTPSVIAPVVVIGSLIVGLLLALLVYRRRSQREARRPSTTPLMGHWRGVWRGREDVEDVEGGDAEESTMKLQDGTN